MTEMTRAESTRLAAVIDYIAKNETKETIGEIKRKFHLTAAEYETAMDLAMPAIRAYCRSRAWKGQFLRLLRELMCLVEPDPDPSIDRKLIDTYDPNPDARLWNLEQKITGMYQSFFHSGYSAEEVLDRRLAHAEADE